MIELPNALLRGSYPPLVTPFGDDGGVDYDSYARLVDFQAGEGSHGIVTCGTTGEPSLLTVAERQRLTDTAVQAAAGRLPVVAATGSQSLADTIALTEHATSVGAAAVLFVTPYFVRPPERGLVVYFTEVAACTDLPLLLYHIPGRAAVTVSLDTVVAIADQAPTFVGMKHAAVDLSLVTDVLGHLGPEFRLLVGLEELALPMLAIGAAGMVNAVGNVAPRRVAALYDAMADGKMDEARRLHFELNELNRAVFFDSNPIPMKYMMRRVGLLPRNAHRPPMVPADPEVERRLDGVLERAGLL